MYQNKKRFPYLENYTWASYGDYDRKQMKLDSTLPTKSYIFALANGAEKLFYVNLRLPPFFPSQAEGGPGFSDLSALIDYSGKPTPLFSAHQTIALKLGSLQEVEITNQQIRGKTILEGQYRFSKDDRVIHVLWGSHVAYYIALSSSMNTVLMLIGLVLLVIGLVIPAKAILGGKADKK